MVIWITGLSGVGKTTIAQSLYALFKKHIPELVLVDGDEVRELFGNDLGYDERARQIQIGRIQRLARLLDMQGLMVVVAALYANPELLAWNRENFQTYFEVYLEASISSIRLRSRKDVYRRAERGELHDVVGMDVPWHIPNNPDLVINMDCPENPERICQRISERIPRLSAIISGKR